MKPIDFMGKRKIATVVSAILLLISLGSLAVSGLNRGLDFTGGSLVEVGFADPIEAEEVRTFLEAQGRQDFRQRHQDDQKDQPADYVRPTDHVAVPGIKARPGRKGPLAGSRARR